MIEKLKYRIKVLRKLLPFTVGVKRYFVFIFVFSVLTAAVGFLEPLVYRVFINNVILGGQIGKIIFVIAGYVGLFLINKAISYGKYLSKTKLVNKTTFRVKSRIWDGYLRIPFFDYEHMSVGDLKMRLEDDTKTISQFAERQSIQFVTACIQFVVSAVLIFVIDWRLAIITILTMPLTYVVDDYIAKKLDKINDSNRENEQETSSWLHTTAQNWRETRALNLEKYQQRKYIKFIHRFALFYGRIINYRVINDRIFPRIYDDFVMQFNIYLAGGLLILFGKMTIGDLLVFIMYYGIFTVATAAISNIDAELQSDRSIIDRLVEELDKSSDRITEGSIIPDDSDLIEFKNVSFAYPDTDKNVISNLSFKIRRGERVAITGRSGCGKTTVLKLLVGMISPDEGNVEFSGIDLQEIKLSEMHRRIGFIMQENHLFNTTIRDNMLYGKSDATDDEIVEACKKAYIYDFIESTPDGLDTVIGEKGIKLSGGQKQRLVLARLFLRNVDILIFDEATSALDGHSESIIQDAINNIAEDKTIIVVAHRESSTRLCKRKIDLEKA